jgi:hypothetical protein
VSSVNKSAGITWYDELALVNDDSKVSRDESEWQPVDYIEFHAPAFLLCDLLDSGDMTGVG